MKKMKMKIRPHNNIVFIENSGFLNNEGQLTQLYSGKFTTKEIDELANKFTSTNESPRDPFRLRHKRIRAQNMIGSLRLGQRKIEILPKFCKYHLDNKKKYLSTISFMLSTIWDLNLSFYENSLIDTVDMNLQDLLSYLFVKELNYAISKGFPKSYVLSKDSLRLVKGRVDFKSTISKYYGLKHIHVCDYDDYLSEHPLKIFFKLTLEKQLKTTRSLAVLTQITSSLSRIQFSTNHTLSQSDIKNLKIPRGFSHLEKAFNLAKILYFGQNILQTKGSKYSSSFLFSMPDLFERYIGKFIFKNSRKFSFSSVVLQENKNLFEKLDIEENVKSFSIKPDIVIKTNSGNRIIIDTKYKNLEKCRKTRKIVPSITDINQMNSYISRYTQVDDRHKSIGILLYPNSSKDLYFKLKGLGGFSSIFIVSIGLGDDYKSSDELLTEKFKKIFSTIDKLSA